MTKASKTTAKQARNSRFNRMHPLFNCRVCKKLTRNPDDGGTELCKECYEDAGIENHHSDYGADHKEHAALKPYCEACGGKTYLQRRQESEPRNAKKAAPAKAKPPTVTEQVAALPKSEHEVLADATNAALTELGRFADKTWKEYGIVDAALDTEIVKGITARTHVANRADQIKAATSISEVAARLKKGQDSVFSTAMFLWANGKATGPMTAERMERKAHEADQLAKHLEKLGKDDNAKAQRERAAKLRHAAATGERMEIVKQPKAKKEPAQPKPCVCGCGGTTKGSFVPGHDSKVHGLAKRFLKGEEKGAKFTPAAIEYMKAKNWLDPSDLKKLKVVKA